MYNLLSNLLIKHNIDIFAPVSLSDCEIKRAYLLEREGISNGTAFIIAVPYLSKNALYAKRNVSLYAAPRDYHLFFEELFADIVPVLREKFPSNKFAAFTDHSPIDEVDAALKAGLGILGDNGMLICEKYSSFVFLGEIITDMKLDCAPHAMKKCEGCGACASACKGAFNSKKEGCISHLSQSKADADGTLVCALKASGLVWGCDDCSLVCPHTKKAIADGSVFTGVDFFKQDVIPYLTSELILNMSDEDFAKRAYSWRKKEVILRNLEIFENSQRNEGGTLC